MNPLKAPITARSAATGHSPGSTAMHAIAAPRMALVPQRSTPRRPDLRTPASSIPTSVPAATLEIHSPKAVGEVNR